MTRTILFASLGLLSLAMTTTDAEARPDFPIDLSGAWDDPQTGMTFGMNIFLRGNNQGMASVDTIVGNAGYVVDWEWDGATDTMTASAFDPITGDVTIEGQRTGNTFAGTFTYGSFDPYTFMPITVVGTWSASAACDTSAGTAQVRDCLGVCYPVTWIGDGICDDNGVWVADFTDDQCTAQNWHWSFNNDNGDCDDAVPGVCQAPIQTWIGDGYCDGTDYNNADCDWDGGDCCETTCVDNTYTCGTVGYTCLDPNAP